MKLNQHCLFSIGLTVCVHGFSETWLKANILLENIKIDSYAAYRKDRSDNSGYGGKLFM
jgi:hypothetical protein